MKHKLILFILLILLFFSYNSVAEKVIISVGKDNFDMNLPQDDWLNLTLMGTKIGYAHIYMDKSKYDGQDAILIRSEMSMKLKRIGLGIELHRSKTAYFDLNLLPLYFVTNSNETGEDKKIEGKIENNVVSIKTTLSGQTKEIQKIIPENVIFEEMLSFIAIQKGLKIGNEWTVDVFNLELLRPVKTHVEVLRTESLKYDGTLIPVYVLSNTIDLMGGLTSREWISEDGATYRMETDMMGITMVLEKSDMNKALGEVGEVDVIITTKIFPEGEPPHEGIDYFKALVDLGEKGDLSKAIMQNSRQKLTVNPDETSGILEISTLKIDEKSAKSLPLNDLEVAEFLKPTMYIQADTPSIVQKSKELVDSERNSWKAAQLICKWVYESIKDKNLKTGFGSAKQTLETLEGDCTEHTVLFIALARAAGIPSRICAGLVYNNDAFYYHFWPEVYVGKWIQMEPTLGQMEADATHILLSGGQLESESVLEYGEGVIRTLNRLRIRVIE